ncbi:MAG: hypothetical protein O2805_10335 [Proteobacteria bacterium]|nr:hypothetical protein [Pseudomonadota bacterium]
MTIGANDYSYHKMLSQTTMDRMFSVNRTTLNYTWGIFMPGPGQWWSSDGGCGRYNPKI